MEHYYGNPNYFEELALGKVPNKSRIYKFGRNDNVGATPVLIAEGGVHGLPSTALVIEAISDNVNDIDAGTGARTLKVFVLDENFDEQEIDLVMNGTSASLPSSIKAIRVNRAWVQTAGSTDPKTGGNLGTITIRQVGGDDMVKITPNKAQTLTANYTVPRGYHAIMWSADATVGEGKDVEASLKTREYNTDQPFRTKGIRDGFEGTVWQRFVIPSPVTEKSDICFVAKSSGAGTPCSATFMLELIKNEE